jgi:hypothetical protein
MTEIKDDIIKPFLMGILVFGLCLGVTLLWSALHGGK